MGDDIAASLVAPLAALALVPVDATVSTAGKRRVLRILVDRDLSSLDPHDAASPVPPLSLDEVADATRVVGDEVERSAVMGERPYTLEVSSPGVSRPLVGYAALRRNVGRLVTLSLHDGRQPEVTGRLRAVRPDEVTVDVPAARRIPAETRTLPLTDIRSGAVQVEFSRSDGAETDRYEDADTDTDTDLYADADADGDGEDRSSTGSAAAATEQD